MEKGYCMKCRMKREMKNAKKMVKSGRHFMVGKCAKCGTKMYKIVSAK